MCLHSPWHICFFLHSDLVDSISVCDPASDTVQSCHVAVYLILQTPISSSNGLQTFWLSVSVFAQQIHLKVFAWKGLSLLKSQNMERASQKSMLKKLWVHTESTHMQIHAITTAGMNDKLQCKLPFFKSSYYKQDSIKSVGRYSTWECPDFCPGL